MYEIVADYCEGAEFRAHARGHELISDQPPQNGGADHGLTPPELLLASLATCAGYYALQYLRTRSLNTNGLSVRVTAEKSATRPVRLERFRVTVDAPFVPCEHELGLRRSIEACLVEKTLIAPSAIEVDLTFATEFTHS